MMRALRQTMPILSSIRSFSYGGDGNPVMHDQASRLQQQPASSSLFHPAASDKSIEEISRNQLWQELCSDPVYKIKEEAFEAWRPSNKWLLKKQLAAMMTCEFHFTKCSTFFWGGRRPKESKRWFNSADMTTNPLSRHGQRLEVNGVSFRMSRASMLPTTPGTACSSWRSMTMALSRQSPTPMDLIERESLSFKPYVRGYATRKKVDIGARARQLQTRRLWGLVLTGTLVSGFIIVVLNTFQENLMYYITPSEAMEKFFKDPSKNRFRLGGLVLEGSVQHLKNSTEMEFVVTDLANEILVRYRGALPDLFREGHSVVAEGFVRPIEKYPGIQDSTTSERTAIVERAKECGCYFAATEVLAKHDEKYMPKEVAAAVARNKALQHEAPAAVSAMQEAPVTFTPPSDGKKQKGVAQAPVVAQTYEIKA
ncbi:hypothetical protein BDL97_12G024200 [Sphagnum fallax]|nr:hypothetical protein BDL97_12G024200 [Sphagnum fallax]